MFLLARVVLYAAWPDSFADLDGAGIAAAFGRGFVMDASILAVALAPAVLALCLPFGFAAGRTWRGVWGWLAFAVLCAGILVLAGDIAYFGMVGRHVGPELVAFVDDPHLMWGIVWESYRLTLAGVLLLLLVLAWLWRRLMAWDAARVGAPAPAWSLALIAPLFFVAIRGNVTGKPIGTVDAFRSGSVSSGYLALNGPFSIAHSIPNAKNLRFEFMSEELAVASVREHSFAGSPAEDPQFPLLRRRAGGQGAGPREGERPNVVVLLLESWDGDVVDALRLRRGDAPLGLTPNFDRLAGQGVLFTRCYAAGQRSTHGLFAVLTGLPSLPGMPYLGSGIEQSRLSYLGQMAKAEGYSTHFLQGSTERSFRLDSVAALAGFEHYMGKESIERATGRPPMASWGSWDHDLLEAAHQVFVESQKPFLGLAFTTSTHLPFQVPEGHGRPYADDTEEHRYWNSIHYADGALGQFFASAREAGYYDETVFVLVSDHRSGVGFARLGALEKHHIPCLVIAPGLAAGVEDGVRSQLDVMPTVAELARWSGPMACLGSSMLRATAATRGALCMRSEIVLRVEDRAWVAHDLRRRMESGADARAAGDGGDRGDLPPLVADAVEGRMLAEVQLVAELLRTNRVLPPPASSAR